MAKKNRYFEDGLIFYSNQGVQNSNYKFANYLEPFNIVRSMSKKVNCRDNVVADLRSTSRKPKYINNE